MALTMIFLAAAVLLVYVVRNEIAYFFADGRPAQKWTPTPEIPVPPDAGSNVYAEIRVDPVNLCDHWDPTLDPFLLEDSYAFTLKMGFGNSYFLTCVGKGETRPRLWILKPETPDESQLIHEKAMRERISQSILDTSVDGPLPEIHIPGRGCVNDLCAGGSCASPPTPRTCSPASAGSRLPSPIACPPSSAARVALP